MWGHVALRFTFAGVPDHVCHTIEDAVDRPGWRGEAELCVDGGQRVVFRLPADAVPGFHADLGPNWTEMIPVVGSVEIPVISSWPASSAACAAGSHAVSTLSATAPTCSASESRELRPGPPWIATTTSWWVATVASAGRPSALRTAAVNSSSVSNSAIGSS